MSPTLEFAVGARIQLWSARRSWQEWTGRGLLQDWLEGPAAQCVVGKEHCRVLPQLWRVMPLSAPLRDSITAAGTVEAMKELTAAPSHRVHTSSARPGWGAPAVLGGILRDSVNSPLLHHWLLSRVVSLSLHLLPFVHHH